MLVCTRNGRACRRLEKGSGGSDYKTRRMTEKKIGSTAHIGTTTTVGTLLLCQRYGHTHEPTTPVAKLKRTERNKPACAPCACRRSKSVFVRLCAYTFVGDFQLCGQRAATDTKLQRKEKTPKRTKNCKISNNFCRQVRLPRHPESFCRETVHHEKCSNLAAKILKKKKEGYSTWHIKNYRIDFQWNPFH